MGYNGRILLVDLTSDAITQENIPERVYRDFIGGQGLGVRILYERIKPKADPLGPDNILGFVVGPRARFRFVSARNGRKPSNLPVVY